MHTITGDAKPSPVSGEKKLCKKSYDFASTLGALCDRMRQRDATLSEAIAFIVLTHPVF
jgi:hypothetical protein